MAGPEAVRGAGAASVSGEVNVGVWAVASVHRPAASSAAMVRLALQQRREGCRHDEEQRAQEEKLIRWRLALAQEADAAAAAAVEAVGAVEAVEAVEAVGAVEAAPAVAVRSEAACCAKAWTSAEGDVAALDAMPSAMRDQQLGNALYPVVAAQLGDEALALLDCS